MKIDGKSGFSLLLVVFLTIFVLSSSGSSFAQGWEQIGLSGLVTGGVAGHPDTPDTIFAVSGDSVYRSIDGGTSFVSVFGSLNSQNFTAINISPLNADNILVGTSHFLENAKVYFSASGGDSWGEFPHSYWTVEDIESDPGVMSDFWITTANDLVKRDVTVGDFGGSDFEIHPLDNQHLFLGIGDSLGVGISTDGGATWNYYNEGLPTLSTTDIEAIALHPTDPSVLFLGVKTGINPASFEAYISSDSGHTFTQLNWTTTMGRITAAVIDPTMGSEGTVFIVSSMGAYRMPLDTRFISELNDGLVGGATSVNSITLVPGTALYAGTDDGLWRWKYLPNLALAARKLDDTSGGNGDGVPQEGEQVALTVYLHNFMFAAAGVTGSITTSDVNVVIDDGDAAFPDVPGLGSASNSADPFLVSINAGAPHAHVADLDLVLTSNSGEYVDTLTVGIAIARHIILLVDDDEGQSYEVYYTATLDTLDQTDTLKNIYDHWDVQNYGPAAEIIQAPWTHDPVIWFTGDAVENTLTAEDRTAIETFLDDGGDCILTGQNIAEDLAGSDFLTTYLGIDWSQLIVDPVAHGIPGDPVSGNLQTIITQGSLGANNQYSRDELSIALPEVGAVSFVYDTTAFNIAGVRIEKDNAGVRDGRCLFLGFGFESVSSGGSPLFITRTAMMRDMLRWLRVPTGIEDGSEEPAGAVPRVFTLGQNYPNPFNPQTSISFTVPGSAGEKTDVSLSVYDIRGRLVNTLLEESRESGSHTIVWNGRDESGRKVSSGIYFYRLESGEKVAVRKMVILK